MNTRPGLPSLEALEQAIEREAGKLSIPVPEPALLRSLAAHLRLLYLWNPRVNLTAIRDPVDGVRRHVLESLEADRFLPEEGLLADLGSGNGYPALPCLAVKPALTGALFESVSRKVDFLRAALRESKLGLRVEATHRRFDGPESLPSGTTTVTMRGFPSPALWCLRVFDAASVQRVLAWLSREDAASIAESAVSAGLVPTVSELKAHPRGALLVILRG